MPRLHCASLTARSGSATTALALALAAGLYAPGHAAAEEPAATPADRGFSYFIGLARQHNRYVETGSILPFRSETRGGTPMLVTGALYALNERVLLSLDNETTFYPDRAGETWTATEASFNGITLTSPVLQTNGFALQQSKTQLLGHYRVQDHVFGMGGLTLRTQSFQRFSFLPGPDVAVATPPNSTVEESIAELLFNVGIGIESEEVRGKPTHYSLRANVGVPVWRRLTNTTVPQTRFNSKRGLDLSLEGRYSWAVSDKIHFGAWSSWTMVKRSPQRLRNLEMPRSRLDSIGYGVEALWKL